MTDVLVFDTRSEPLGAPLDVPVGWNTTQIRTLESAKVALKSRAAEVIIAFGEEETISGLELLADARDLCPSAIRLSVVADGSAHVRQGIDGPAHARLLGDVDAGALERERTRRVTLDSHLAAQPVRTFMSNVTAIPSFPHVYNSIVEELDKPDSDLKRIARILITDPGLTARVLQIVNSPFYGMRRRIHDTVQAIGLLGMQNLLSMVLAAEVFNAFEAGAAGLSLNRLWSHSTATAACARRIAHAAGAPRDDVMMAFVAGILHDGGRLILGSEVPDAHRSFANSFDAAEAPFEEAERRALGVSHAEVGAYLLDVWNLPTGIVEAVAFHHEPSRSRDTVFTPLTAVHLAEVFQQEYGADGIERGVELDTDYLEGIGILEEVESWRETCRPDHD
jgi:HD-like signal output (HDOD) protein